MAILHTFAAARFTALAHRLEIRHEERTQARGRPATPSVAAELVHFFGEIEVVFGLWAVVLLVAMTSHVGWDAARYYISDTVDYTEALFVVVIMAMAATRPIIGLAQSTRQRVGRRSYRTSRILSRSLSFRARPSAAG